jgi:hypothetical protein
MKVSDNMKVSDKTKADAADDLRPEYEEAELKQLLTNGVRGKYMARFRQGTNLVKLAPDIAAAFPTEDAVNDALRKLLAVGYAVEAS